MTVLNIGNVFKLYELDLISDSSNLFKEVFINDNSFLEISSLEKLILRFSLKCLKSTFIVVPSNFICGS